MRSYPATSKEFLVNGKVHRLQKYTLLLLTKIEDDLVDVSFRDVLEQCTDMGEVDMLDLNDEQFEEIYALVSKFSEPDEKVESVTPLRAIELVALLMNKGHMDAQYYRLDFAEVVVKEMSRGFDGEAPEKSDAADNEAVLKEVFG